MREMGKWFREARRRRVFRTAALYVVGAWVVLQVVDLALESFGFPDTALRFLWYAAVAAFPVALVFGWRYDLTADGIRKTRPDSDGSPADLSLRRSDYVILAALAAIVVTIGWRTVAELRSTEAELGETIARAIDPNALAVLPLANLSGDPSQEYLSAGMHDALITSLSKLRSLRVTSRTSAALVRREPLSMQQIAARLGVSRVLEGSVAREGNRVFVNVHLVDAVSDRQIWSDTFERDFEGALSLQNEIARTVAREIEINLSPAEQRALPVDVDVRASTYEAWLRAKALLHGESLEQFRRGVEIMQQAVQDDPQSALAHAGLAYAWLKFGHNPLSLDREIYAAVRDAATRALELDDTLAEAHLAMGMYNLYYVYDWIAAERSLKRAIEINPSLVEAHYHYAWMLELFHDNEEALVYGENTKRLDPLSPFMTAWLADQYRSAGLYDLAIAEAEATLELSPGYPVALYVLGNTLSEMGSHERALAVHERLAGHPIVGFAWPATLARAGRAGEARQLAAQIPEEPVYAVPHLFISAALHEDERVFHWLAVAKEVHSAWYPWLLTWNRETRYLVDDPRLKALAAELDLPLPNRRHTAAIR